MTNYFADNTIRPIKTEEWQHFHIIWETSQDADDRAGRPRDGWWHLNKWAESGLVLSQGSIQIGLAAFKQVREPDAVEVRMAVLPQYRQPEAVKVLVEAVFEKAREDGFSNVRFFISGGGSWATSGVANYGIQHLRSYHAMLLPGSQEVPEVPMPKGILIRPLAEGEDETLLAALNRAWATTWNFRPILMRDLQKDLVGQRRGFLVAVPLADQTNIIGTSHAIFDPAETNYDGSVYARISNLTNDPDWRGRGLGRALLTAGVRHLRERGATSVTLGVDGGNPVPMALYGSMGFRSISRLEVWTGKIPELR